MKKLMIMVAMFSFVLVANATTTTYTENFINKYATPVIKKEKELQDKKAAMEESQKKKQEELRKEQEAKKQELENFKNEHNKKIEQKKKALDELFKY